MTASRSPAAGPPVGAGRWARLLRRGRAHRIVDVALVVSVPVAGWHWARSTDVVTVMAAGGVFVAAGLLLCARHEVTS